MADHGVQEHGIGIAICPILEVVTTRCSFLCREWLFAIKDQQIYQCGHGCQQYANLQHPLIPDVIPADKKMRNGDKAQKVDGYRKILAKPIPVPGLTPESTEQKIEHIDRQDLEQRVSPDLPETSDQDKNAQDKYDSGEKSVGITIVQKYKIAAQEYAVCC